jgi:hypothetical protein
MIEGAPIQLDGGKNLNVVIKNSGLAMRQLCKFLTQLETELLEITTCQCENKLNGSSLQSVDLVIQIVDELSKFLERVSNNVPSGIRIDLEDAISAIKLQDVQDMIEGEFNRFETYVELPENIDVSLF